MKAIGWKQQSLKSEQSKVWLGFQLPLLLAQQIVELPMCGSRTVEQIGPVDTARGAPQETECGKGDPWTSNGIY